jgi:hypothetical protein
MRWKKGKEVRRGEGWIGRGGGVVGMKERREDARGRGWKDEGGEEVREG